MREVALAYAVEHRSKLKQGRYMQDKIKQAKKKQKKNMSIIEAEIVMEFLSRTEEALVGLARGGRGEAGGGRLRRGVSI